MTDQALLAAIRALPGVCDVALAHDDASRWLLVALVRFHTDEDAVAALCASYGESAPVLIVPYIQRTGSLVDPAWLRRVRRTGTTLPDVPAPRPRLETERLVLRRFCRGDLAAMRRLHRDPVTMATLDGPHPDDATSDRAVEWADGRFTTPPLGHFAIERRVDGAVLGWVGFSPLDVGVPLPSDVQIGWRLHRDYWGAGYATEAARAVMDAATSEGSVARVVAITATTNERSRRLMDRLGLVRLADLDFDHPLVAEGSALRRHVVYASAV